MGDGIVLKAGRNQDAWVLHGAENGYPRLHKFVRVGDAVFSPDIGVTAEIPSHG